MSFALVACVLFVLGLALGAAAMTPGYWHLSLSGVLVELAAVLAGLVATAEMDAEEHGDG